MDSGVNILDRSILQAIAEFMRKRQENIMMDQRHIWIVFMMKMV